MEEAQGGGGAWEEAERLMDASSLCIQYAFRGEQSHGGVEEKENKEALYMSTAVVNSGLIISFVQ